MKKFYCWLVSSLVLVAVVAAAQSQPVPPAAAKAAFDRASELAKQKDQQAAATVAAYFEAIENYPEYLEAHEGLQDFRFSLAGQVSQETTATIQAKYREWERRWPESAGIAWGVVRQFHWGEDPAAQAYLLKIVQQRPQDARAWKMLSDDAERRGDGDAAREYLRKATEAEPDNPDYAFYYAGKVAQGTPGGWDVVGWEVVRRFPNHDRAAQSLFFLGTEAKDDADKIRILEQQRRDYPAAKFMWSSAGTNFLFDVYLRVSPDKAHTLAQEMAAAGGEGAKMWTARVEYAGAFAQVKRLVSAGKFDEATALIDGLKADRNSWSPDTLLLLKAEVLAGAGNHAGAYDSLLKRFAQWPADEIYAGLARSGKALGKDAKAISSDVWAIRDAAAKPAPGFELGLYTSDQKLSLASLRGKVVFVTFWFPGCGPCRAEFPHFESVVQKFKRNADLVYLGINGIPQQDPYVLPFMQGTKYSFTPLKGDKVVTGPAPEGYGVRGYPHNLLIDRDGRIVFVNFRVDDESSETVLGRMIESLLARPTQG